MKIPHWLKSLARSLAPAAKGRRSRRGRPAPAPRVPLRLEVEVLEARLAPAVFTVVNTLASGAGSLSDALAQANSTPGADIITFDPAVFGTPQTIPLATELHITDSVTITGPGAALLTILGDVTSHVFDVNDGTSAVQTVQIEGLTIAHTPGEEFVAGDSFGGDGGGIYNAETLTVVGCVIPDNLAEGGAGICNVGTLTLNASTVTNNGQSPNLSSDPEFGGGILNGGGSMTLTDSTISNNQARDAGGGIYNYDAAGPVVISNCTISGNNTYLSGGRDGGPVSILAAGFTARAV